MLQHLVDVIVLFLVRFSFLLQILVWIFFQVFWNVGIYVFCGSFDVILLPILMLFVVFFLLYMLIFLLYLFGLLSNVFFIDSTSTRVLNHLFYFLGASNFGIRHIIFFKKDKFRLKQLL